jgi:hypothetical protein
VFVQNFAPGWLDRLEILGRAAAATAAARVLNYVAVDQGYRDTENRAGADRADGVDNLTATMAVEYAALPTRHLAWRRDADWAGNVLCWRVASLEWAQ